ncbi:MAG: tetratricopeptide repeat protein, partial [Pseudomonadota bacterium]
AGAVHDQVQSLSAGAAPIAVGLSDLPVAGKADRSAARAARADRNGGLLAYALDVERAVDAEAHGDAQGALAGFARALSRDAEGIEALDGIKRLAGATGDRRGAARAGLRLAAVLRNPVRAAAEFSVAAQILEDLSQPAEAVIAYWHALAREPDSTWLHERLRHLLSVRADWAGLDQLLSHRLAGTTDFGARVALLIERGEHRLRKLEDRKAAIEDFKRVLMIDPKHAVSLRYLATLATQMDHFPQAVRLLERLLEIEEDETQALRLRLELAEAHEAAREPARAADVLRRAASTRPREVAPWQRLTDLLLRTGDWSAALATLRSWDAVLGDPTAKAVIWVRIGCLLRDHGRDVPAAADAFETAADLDQLGDGIFQLAALHEQSGASVSRRAALVRAIASMRRALLAEPLDVPRLRRLRELYEALGRREDLEDTRGAGPGANQDQPDDGAVAAAGTVVTGQLLALAGEDVDLPPPRRPHLGAKLAANFWTRLRPVGAVGFAAEIWPTLAAAAAELLPTKLPPRERVAAGAERRLAWVEDAAAAVGLPEVELFLIKGAAGPTAASDPTVVPVEGSPPALLMGRGVLAGDAVARFRVGRALSLLRDRAAVFDRMGAAEVTALLTAAAVVAGAAASGAPAVLKGVEERARVLAKAMSRKDRKALELEASRFGFEPIDAALFRQSVLTGADRFGLLLAGDAAVAVRHAGQTGADAAGSPPPAALLANPRAAELIRFALGEDYLMLRQAIGAGGED